MPLPKKNEYKEKIAKFQGKETRSIQILKKEDKECEEAIKRVVNENLVLIHTLRIYLKSISVKEVLRSCGTTRGLALTSSRRSLKKRSTI
jgi:hypothetical protein